MTKVLDSVLKYPSSHLPPWAAKKIMTPISTAIPDNMARFFRPLSFLGDFCGSIGRFTLFDLSGAFTFPAPHGTGCIKSSPRLYGQFGNAYNSFYNRRGF